MPRLRVVASCILLAAASPLSAGLAIFDPPLTVIALGHPEVSIDITIQAEELPYFNSVDAVLVATDPIVLAYNFEYAPEFMAAADSGVVGDYICVWCQENQWYAGGLSRRALGFGGSIPFGTVTIDTSYLALGEYDVYISSALDGGISALRTLSGGSEPINGVARIIIPEPSTATLALAIAVLLIWRRPM